MPASRRTQPAGRRAECEASERRNWLAQALAGVAFGMFASDAVAEPTAPPERALLGSLLRRNHELCPDFRGGLSNHVSMGLYSLWALGADGTVLARFADARWSSLEPLPKDPGPRVTTENWTALLGRREALNGFRALFAAEVAQLGRDRVLRRYLPGLLPGIGGGAFHPLIRTGYGVRFDDDAEVIAGLAYWATAFLPLGPLAPPGRERDPRVLFQQISETPTLAGRDLSGRLIFGKMQAAAALPAFAPLASALNPDDGTLASIAAATVRLYVQSRDFTALHAVTGTHAYRLLRPFIEPPEQGLRYFWQALAAAYISIGAPRMVEPPPGDAPPWNESIQRAIATLDDHDVKLVDVARAEGSFYGGSIYRRAAARRMRLI
jgi:hypothetical protein